jgi:hypothetical protein
VLHSVAATTEEVAGATGIATGFADILGDFGEINRLDDLAGSRRGLGILERRIAAVGEFFVGAGGVMADQAIDVLL